MRDKHFSALSCAASRSALPQFLQKHNGMITAAMSLLFLTRRCCGASASTAASSSVLSRVLGRGSVSSSVSRVRVTCSAGTLNDAAVVVRLQVTLREAAVFVDGYAAGSRRRLRRRVPAAAFCSGFDEAAV